MKKLLSNKSPVTDVTNHQVEILEVHTDAHHYSRIGWAIILIGVLGFFVWASFAPLDKGVPLSGNVAVASSRKLIQHQGGGIIDDILVKDGDEVKAGQALVKMNNTNAKASADIVRVQMQTAQATEARLIAERDGLKSVTFPKEFDMEKSDPHVVANMSLQRQLFNARRLSIESELGAADESIAGSKIQLKGLQESMVDKKQQQQILKEQLAGMRDLAKDGFVARNRLLDLERTYAQVNGSISEDLGNIGRLSRQIAELNLRKVQRQQDYQKEVRSQLAEVQKEVEATKSRLDALDFDLKNVLVTAPVDGTVVGLNVFTKGGVVPAGFKLMELVPKDDALIVEAVLPVHLVDKVHKGLKAELIFSAFNSNTTPHIPGVITQVSADRTVDERTGQSFYKVRAEVAPEGKKLIAHLHIRPGMPVELFVRTGERTMMNYLLKPVFDRANSAMTEE